jgi:prepilin-type processing-associated H-X9-DG protein
LDLNGSFFGKSKIRLTDITDGSSNTVILSELLVRPDTTAHDIRGRMWNSIHAGTSFSTIYPPNSSVGDNVMGYCVREKRMPCGTQSVLNSFSLARSWHANGVNAGMGDGSVRFVADRVAPKIWLALGSRNGGEAEND